MKIKFNIDKINDKICVWINIYKKSSKLIVESIPYKLFDSYDIIACFNGYYCKENDDIYIGDVDDHIYYAKILSFGKLDNEIYLHDPVWNDERTIKKVRSKKILACYPDSNPKNIYFIIPYKIIYNKSIVLSFKDKTIKIYPNKG